MISLRSFILFLLIIGIIACTNTSIDNLDEQKVAKTDSQTTYNCSKEKIDDVFDIPNLAVAELEEGQMIDGRKVKEYLFYDEKNFSFTLDGKFKMKGVLSYGECANVVFTPVEDIRQRMNIVCNGIEKPLYMWTEMLNENQILASLDNATLADIQKMESPEFIVEFENYRVVASGFHISAYANFLSVDLCD